MGSRAAHVVKETPPAPADHHLPPGRVEDTLFALECTTPSMIEGRVTADRVLEAVTDEVRRSWPECPRLLRDEEHDERSSRFGGFRTRYRSNGGGEGWRGEVLWRAVHPMVAGAPVTTRVTLEERAEWLRLGVRVTADEGPSSVHGFVGAGQAQPRFLSALRACVPFTWLGGRLEARRIRPGDEEDFVQSVMAGGLRSYPVVVLTPLEEGGYVIDPDDLLWELFGRARLYVFEEHPQTFKLTDLMRDRRMSCYLGAARCYMPGWSMDDDPFDHPLLLSERLADPVMRAAWSGEIGQWYGRTVRLPEPLDDEGGDAGAVEEPEARAAGVVPAPPERSPRHAPSASPRDGSGRHPAEAAPTSEPAAGRFVGAPVPGSDGAADALPPTDNTSLDAVTTELRELATLVRGLVEVHGALRDEVERLRTLAAVRASITNAIERRLGQLETLLEGVVQGRGPGEDRAPGVPAVADASGAEDEGRLSLVDVVRSAAETHSGALLVLESALAAAAESPYEDPERVKAILDAMARVARKRGDGTLGTSLREAFNDLGIDYRGAIASATPARLRQQYEFRMPDGEPIQAEEHIALGNTYDPRRCLRIYFSSRVPTETRFVIGHVGRHFEVRSTT